MAIQDADSKPLYHSSEADLEAPSISVTDVSDVEASSTEATQVSESETSNNDDEEYDSDHTATGVEYIWEPHGFSFLRRISNDLTTHRPGPGLTFKEHQHHWRSVFGAILAKVTDKGEANTQLTVPPIPKLEVELLDPIVLDTHGCGLHCPCDLDRDRDVHGKVFILECETGLTGGEFLKQLGEVLYGEDEPERYGLMRDVFAGGLDFDKFNWMSSDGEMFPPSRTRYNPEERLPCLYVEVIGRRAECESKEKGKLLDERGIPIAF